MSNHTLRQPADRPSSHGDFMIRSLPKAAALTVFMGLLLFGSAGTLNWTAAWVLLALYATLQIIGLLVVPHGAELLDERTHMKAGVKSWDKPLGLVLSAGSLVVFIVCGLDHRYGWTPPLETRVTAAGLTLFVLGEALYLWSLATNPFFSRFVRIQSERGHTVISTGPYRYVRHPGYVGAMAFTLGCTLTLASLWGLVPALLLFALTCVRTALEDRTLHEELDGYRAYAARVRYRLIPGVW